MSKKVKAFVKPTLEKEVNENMVSEWENSIEEMSEDGVALGVEDGVCNGDCDECEMECQAEFDSLEFHTTTFGGYFYYTNIGANIESCGNTEVKASLIEKPCDSITECACIQSVTKPRFTDSIFLAVNTTNVRIGSLFCALNAKSRVRTLMHPSGCVYNLDTILTRAFKEYACILGCPVPNSFAIHVSPDYRDTLNDKGSGIRAFNNSARLIIEISNPGEMLMCDEIFAVSAALGFLKIVVAAIHESTELSPFATVSFDDAMKFGLIDKDIPSVFDCIVEFVKEHRTDI